MLPVHLHRFLDCQYLKDFNVCLSVHDGSGCGSGAGLTIVMHDLCTLLHVLTLSLQTANLCKTDGLLNS